MGASDTPMCTGKGHILVCEGNADLAQAVMLAIGDAFHIDYAPTVEHANCLLATKPFDVVIASRHLPDGKGLEILDLAKKLMPSSAGILLASDDPDAEVDKAQQIGDYLVIFKPFDPDHMLAQVEMNAGASRLTRLLRKIAVTKSKELPK